MLIIRDRNDRFGLGALGGSIGFLLGALGGSIGDTVGPQDRPMKAERLCLVTFLGSLCVRESVLFLVAEDGIESVAGPS